MGFGCRENYSFIHQSVGHSLPGNFLLEFNIHGTAKFKRGGGAPANASANIMRVFTWHWIVSIHFVRCSFMFKGKYFWLFRLGSFFFRPGQSIYLCRCFDWARQYFFDRVNFVLWPMLRDFRTLEISLLLIIFTGSNVNRRI